MVGLKNVELTSHHEYIKNASTYEMILIENRKPAEGLVYNQGRMKDRYIIR